MPRIPRLRVVVESQPQSGAWNMAVDEVLLESAGRSSIATLRWYRWAQPTVSLGYFQASEEFYSEGSLAHLPVVRRLTGGGAILHDHELTYSISLPESQTLFAKPEFLYDIVHGAICNALRGIGFPVVARGTTFKLPDEPLLCFQRKDAHDVVLNGCKVLGSAQRRRHGAIMEHGSLILKASEFAGQIPGIQDLAGKDLPPDLTGLLNESVASAISENWSHGALSADEISLAEVLCENAVKNVRSR